MAQPREFDRDEVTQRTSRIAMLEIRAEAGEKANQEVIGLKPVVTKLKYAIAVLGVLGVCVNFGYALFDKASHYATKKEVTAHEERINRMEKSEELLNQHIQDQTEAFKRLADTVDRLNDHLLRERSRGGR
jgi:cell division protein FtsL